MQLQSNQRWALKLAPSYSTREDTTGHDNGHGAETTGGFKQCHKQTKNTGVREEEKEREMIWW